MKRVLVALSSVALASSMVAGLGTSGRAGATVRPRSATTARASLASANTAGASAPTASATTASATTHPSCPWLDTALPIATRVKLLVDKMTLPDKIDIVEGHGTNNAYVFYMAGIPSLCIPNMGLEDGPNGVGDGMKGVTQLPAGVALAATWDPALAHSYGQVIGAEEAGKGASVNLGPTVNIARDPRWGRSFESLSEDPLLAGTLATSEIQGVQSQGVMSQVKHFDAYNQETNRNTPLDNVIVSDRALHELYMPAFWDAINKGKAASVMCAYSTVNGNYSCENPYLETTTLNLRWGFKGFITSDYGAIHSTSAAVAGTDMEQPFNTYFGAALQQEVANGVVPASVLNGMVSRIFTEMFRFGLFNRVNTGSPSAVVTTPAHQAVSLAVAEAGTTLLKNQGSVLPLSAAGAGSVAVIGPAASVAPTDTGGGSAYVTSTFNVTPLQGIQAAAGSGTSVSYTQGLPTDTSLAAIPSSVLSTPYTGTGFGQTYTATLTAPETGTYVLAFQATCGCYDPSYLAVNNQSLIANPATPPVSTYSHSVYLQANHAYTLTVGGGGPTANLSWATPSELAPGIAQAVAAARKARTAVVVVSDDTESEAADRPTLDLPSAQNELISKVAAANPRTVVVIDAGAPVVMPWLSKVAGVLDAWYPGESNGTALAAILFGQVNPSGHLPVTFPVSLSQVPTHAKALFPGVNGRVLYSTKALDGGLLVGYRYYVTKGVTPLFPFGYGLSYTKFRFSGLHLSRTVVQNRASGPGATSCGCNGQSTTLLTASVRVTNVGKVAGADVAQLYLADPAVAGEPARQLKGFQRVFLQPGQSTMVHFTLNGHDLSYWDNAANGWVVPDGGFRVLVGDSSALANLPLRAGFTVTRTVGARYATVSAPSTVAPVSTFTVSARFVNDGDYALRHVQYALSVPSGWQARPVGRLPSTIVAHQSVPVRFSVRVPLSAQGSTATLTARLTFQPGLPGQQVGLVEASTTVAVSAAVTVTATPLTVNPGSSGTAMLTLESTFPYPVRVRVAATAPSGVTITPDPATILVPPGGATATLTVSVAASTTGSFSIPLASSFAVGGHRYMVAPAQLSLTVPFPSVAAAYDNTGISDNSDPAGANLDGSTDSFSAQALAAGSPTVLTPGASVTVAGTTLTWPNVAVATPDNVVAQGQTIDLSGSGTDLGFLGTANNGTASGTGTVTYTDGTTQAFTLTLADWYANAPATGDTLVTTTTSWNYVTQPLGPHPVSVYFSSVPLQSGKTVASVTLPAISNGVANGVNAMHIFAMGVGTGTPTSG